MNHKSYVFIDRQVSDYAQLLAAAKPDTTVVLLDGDRDGIVQISQVLESQPDVAEIHLAWSLPSMGQRSILPPSMALTFRPE